MEGWLLNASMPQFQALEMTPLETKLLAALRANATFQGEAEGPMAGLCSTGLGSARKQREPRRLAEEALSESNA
jgi:hypothetical protein